ncbi:ThiF family adenylyltransferase [Actinomadura atramentaria]|uniref:ThiF family adenylyltransferase n=1 Tax=Actinomadura atramentaria TaxID=1990 RepID=UPI00037056C8|nr:ThiF family adenylyltransferase [Actinomadura atramentaria]
MPELPRHVTVTAAALALAARGPARLALTPRDLGDLGVVDGAPGTDVLLLPAPPGFDWRLDDPGPSLVGWPEGDGVRVHRVAPGGPPGERVGATALLAGSAASARVQGVLGTDAAARKTVAVLGLGSGGSFITRELAKAGVGRFLLLDHDRLEPGNVSRHECGLGDVGRLKVNAMRDVVLAHHPAARVATSDLRVEGGTLDAVRAFVAEADLVICATDNRESRLLVNGLCLAADVPMILGGVHRRAYGGLVQRVIPGLTPCYQCFVQALPESAADNEISSATSAARVSYTDREVAPQPGLSTDIVPIALMMAKLALVELLTGEAEVFDSLAADLAAPIHQWINRREFAHAGLAPLGNGVDGQTVLRWYGVLLNRLPDCAACGKPQWQEGDADPEVEALFAADPRPPSG